MSALMADSVAQLSEGALEAYHKNELADIAYNDDTLLLGTSAVHVEEFLQLLSLRDSADPFFVTARSLDLTTESYTRG